jgi:hypothetical protein
VSAGKISEIPLFLEENAKNHFVTIRQSVNWYSLIKRCVGAELRGESFLPHSSNKMAAKGSLLQGTRWRILASHRYRAFFIS